VDVKPVSNANLYPLQLDRKLTIKTGMALQDFKLCVIACMLASVMLHLGGIIYTHNQEFILQNIMNSWYNMPHNFSSQATYQTF